ncbi:MAG: histidine phosphatase family protein [Bacteroidales bacterium]|nr:histidine phosphatase family protein [Bacteroidales bacterium]MCF8403679.1 histidine phosphatase family protein [Bacteroidales bacterium]
MKTLYIARHAKSSWDYHGIDDHQRPLLEKGKKRTRYVVNYLQEKNVQIDLIMSSHAVRALNTAKIIAHGIGYPEDKIVISKNIYHGYADSLNNYFYDLSDGVNSLMLVGHNPTFTYFANQFLDKKIDNLPTSGIVCIEFKTDKWEDVFSSDRKTKFIISPKILKDKLSGS